MKNFLVQESACTDPQVIPTANEMNVLSPSCFLPMNEYEEIMALISDDNDNSQEDQASKKSKTLSEEENSLPNLFQPDQPLYLEEVFGPEETLPAEAQVGGSSSHVPRDVAPQTVMTNTSSSMNISISPGMLQSNACTSTFGQGSSSGLVQQLGGNMGVVSSIFSSENCSNSSLSLPENIPKFWPAGSNALYPPQAGTSFGDSIFPKATGNSFTRFESPNFPVHPYGCASPGFGTGASASGLVGNQFQSPSLVHSYAGSGAGANNLGGNSLTRFQSPSLVRPYAGPSAGANNLDGNSLTQFQSPSLVHPYAGCSAGPSAGSGAGANNLDGNSLIQYQSPSLVHLYAGPSVGSGAGGNNLDGNSLTKFQSPSFPVHSYVGPSAGSSWNPVVGTSVTQYKSSSFPVHPYGSASAGGIACASGSGSADASGFAGAANASANARRYGSHQQFIRDHRLEINPLAAPSAMGASPVPMRPQYSNQTQFISRQPFLRNFNDFELVWQVIQHVSMFHKTPNIIIFYYNFKTLI